MTKTLRKAILLGWKMKNTYNKKHAQKNLNSCKKQQRFWAIFRQKTKEVYFCNLSIEDLSDKKPFWKMIKPCFSNKEKIISFYLTEIATLLKSHFGMGVLQ